MPRNTERLLANISSSIGGLYKNLEATEQEAWGLTLGTINKLEYNNVGGLIQNRNNVKVMSQVKTGLTNLLKSPVYTGAIKKFGESYVTIENLQNDWFKSMIQDFNPSRAAEISKNVALSQMVDNLVGGGVDQAVTQKAANILLQNMQAGSNVRTVTEQLRTFMTTSSASAGALSKYSGQIATDSINQYAAAYNEQVTEDLGFEWYQYVGSIRDTTRPFCSALVNQRYIHKSELSKAAQGVLRGAKVSTAGMYPKTNGTNLPVLRGGYNCKHQLRGVATKNVPARIRQQVTGISKEEEKKIKDSQLKNSKQLETKGSVYNNKSFEFNKATLKEYRIGSLEKYKAGASKRLAMGYYGDNLEAYTKIAKSGTNSLKNYYVDGKLIVNGENAPLVELLTAKAGGVRQLIPPRPLMELMSKSKDPAIFSLASDVKTGASYNFGTNKMLFNTLNKRWRNSALHRSKVLSHEFAHAVSHNIGLEYDDFIEYTITGFRGVERQVKSVSKVRQPNALLKKYAEKGFKLIREGKGGQKSLNALDKYIGVKNTLWSTKMSDNYGAFRGDMFFKYSKLGYGQDDINEMIGTAADLLSGATDGRHGYGHGKAYFRGLDTLSKSAREKYAWQFPQKNFKMYSEFVAESSEYVFNGGNPIVDELYPGLGEIFEDFWSDVLTTYNK